MGILTAKQAKAASRYNKGKASDNDALADDRQFAIFRISACKMNPPILTENGERRLIDSCDLLRYVVDSHRSFSIWPFGLVSNISDEDVNGITSRHLTYLEHMEPQVKRVERQVKKLVKRSEFN